jgi:hypothetical protein
VGITGNSTIGIGYDGTNWWIVTSPSGIGGVCRAYQLLASTGAIIANHDFPVTAPSNDYPMSLVWDGTIFHDFIYDNPPTQFPLQAAYYNHSAWDWTVASNKYWVGYSLYDDVGTVHETALGPLASIVMDRRQTLSVTNANLLLGSPGVDDPDKYRIYMLPNATAPAPGTFRLQATDVLLVRLFTNYTGSGTYDGAGTAFPGASGATLQSATAGQGFTLKGNGAINYQGTAFPANPTTEDHFYRSDLEMDFYYDGTRWLSEELFVVKATGLQDANTAISASQAAKFGGQTPDPAGASDIWLVAVNMVAFIAAGGTALGASHHWTLNLYTRSTAGVDTLRAQCVLNSGANSYRLVSDVAIGAAMGVATWFVFTVAKVGTPGTWQGTADITYRIVAV